MTSRTALGTTPISEGSMTLRHGRGTMGIRLPTITSDSSTTTQVGRVQGKESVFFDFEHFFFNCEHFMEFQPLCCHKPQALTQARRLCIRKHDQLQAIWTKNDVRLGKRLFEHGK